MELQHHAHFHKGKGARLWCVFPTRGPDTGNIIKQRLDKIHEVGVWILEETLSLKLLNFYVAKKVFSSVPTATDELVSIVQSR